MASTFDRVSWSSKEDLESKLLSIASLSSYNMSSFEGRSKLDQTCLGDEQETISCEMSKIGMNRSYSEVWWPSNIEEAVDMVDMVEMDRTDDVSSPKKEPLVGALTFMRMLERTWRELRGVILVLFCWEREERAKVFARFVRRCTAWRALPELSVLLEWERMDVYVLEAIANVWGTVSKVEANSFEKILAVTRMNMSAVTVAISRRLSQGEVQRSRRTLKTPEDKKRERRRAE